MWLSIHWSFSLWVRLQCNGWYRTTIPPIVESTQINRVHLNKWEYNDWVQLWHDTIVAPQFYPFIMPFSWIFPSFSCVDLTDAEWWRNNCFWPSVENWTHLSRLEVLNNYFAFFTLLCCMHVDMLLAAGNQWALLCPLIICFFF